MTPDDRDLVISRLIPALPTLVYRAWTEPHLLKQWFAPRPWTVDDAAVDVRPGGASTIVMRSPDGQTFPGRGVYLEVVPGERLVFTDAYTEAWVPSPKPFMTAVLTFEAVPEGTRYTARVRHWSVEDRQAHEAMGFEPGWSLCADQLTALIATLDPAAPPP